MKPKLFALMIAGAAALFFSSSAFASPSKPDDRVTPPTTPPWEWVDVGPCDEEMSDPGPTAVPRIDPPMNDFAVIALDHGADRLRLSIVGGPYSIVGRGEFDKRQPFALAR